MELKVDDTRCIGCGACAATYQDNFDLDGETGLSKVISNENASQEMADVCPVGAITLEGGEEAPAEEEIAA